MASVTANLQSGNKLLSLLLLSLSVHGFLLTCRIRNVLFVLDAVPRSAFKIILKIVLFNLCIIKSFCYVTFSGVEQHVISGKRYNVGRGSCRIIFYSLSYQSPDQSSLKIDLIQQDNVNICIRNCLHYKCSSIRHESVSFEAQ